MTTNIVKLEEGRAIGSNRDVPLSDHEAEALGHLAVALSGISTTIRSAAYKHALNSSHAMKPLKETEDALTDYDALARAAGRKQPKAAEEDDRKGDALAREAAAQVSRVDQTRSSRWSRPRRVPVASTDYVRQVVMADSQLGAVSALVNARRVAPERFHASVPSVDNNPDAPLLTSFSDYLSRVCGLESKSREGVLLGSRRFLDWFHHHHSRPSPRRVDG
ncbi:MULTISPECIES: hypothetical protein [unclassified Mesorhizobium]|uniref:hypothetical protein n=2 Tax=Mesorhizobium TaxID=68287 RepID=UPI0007A94A9B|nr:MULTISPECIES: hypothetical protein [unclassified Mesorhizobium]AMX95403.1 hypothetical protein A4R28_21335 [Mesorhizobium ciceri]WIE92772.1 hypothetical protein P9270_006340 [Mesorhizobium sp. WSM4875]MBZ9798593.1 hypothetical protein [Mesorhizobium sp. ES1-4]MDG4891124.1 hypothetical protein [Mesorhizobium sp. WSM4887]MDG4904268.1 hypothetical protein [Mesorhizobium sp. WSM4962]